jgi:hypothetical protein
MAETRPPRRLVAVLALLGVLAALPGCTIRTGGDAQPGGDAQRGPQAPNQANTGAPATSAAQPASPPVAAPPPDAAHCFLGTYAVTSIVGRQGVDSPFGPIKAAGDGGSLMFDLRTDNTWTLSSDGSKPATFQVGPYTVDALINGTLRGTYGRTGSAFLFKKEDASGTVTLSTPVGTQEKDMDDVGSALAPTGAATMTCRADGLDFASDSVTMALRRL